MGNPEYAHLSGKAQGLVSDFLNGPAAVGRIGSSMPAGGNGGIPAARAA